MTLLMTMMIMMDCSITVSLPYPSFQSIFLLTVDNDDDGDGIKDEDEDYDGDGLANKSIIQFSSNSHYNTYDTF